MICKNGANDKEFDQQSTGVFPGPTSFGQVYYEYFQQFCEAFDGSLVGYLPNYDYFAALL